jgi:hypothetical protein
MLPHISNQVEFLASMCATTTLPDSNGWTIDVWVLSEASVAALADTYRTLLRPELDPRIEKSLAAEGVSLDRLLLDEDHERDAITRADMTELAAAAAALAIDTWAIETILMPNVPKGSRSSSEVGIDIMCVRLDPDGPADSLLPTELLFVASVKHSVSSAVDLLSKLIRSVSAQSLTSTYVAQQIRVLHGRLEERGFVARDRVFLFTDPNPVTSPNTAICMVGAVDTALQQDLAGQMHRLPSTTVPRRHCRHLIISELPRLHERVQTRES